MMHTRVEDAHIQERLEVLIAEAIPGATLTHYFELEGEGSTRADYQERIWNVAWTADGQSGTHRACLDSDGRSMACWGHYFMGDATLGNAVLDLIQRTPTLANMDQRYALASLRRPI
jgi:hypothetical protein